jgi:NAD(P)H-hydrate repair Nnr-like enzyme with NAD(P)H-hydrate dehydratase domain
LNRQGAQALQRRRDSHKGSHGTVAIIGGSEGMLGAALLAGRAAWQVVLARSMYWRWMAAWQQIQPARS